MVDSDGWWTKDAWPPQEDGKIEAYLFFSASNTPERSMQDPGTVIPTITGSTWTLPGSPTGKDHQSGDKESTGEGECDAVVMQQVTM